MSRRTLTFLAALAVTLAPLCPISAAQESDPFVGTWKGTAKVAGLEQVITIVKDGGRWSVQGAFEKDGVVAGTFVGVDVKFADGRLTCRRQFTRKPFKNWDDEDAASLRLEGGRLVASFETSKGQMTVRQFERVPPPPTPARRKEVAQNSPFAGTWKLIDAKQFDETWTFTQTGKGWTITGVFSSKDGTEAGRCHGGSVRISVTALSFTRLIDKSPGPTYKNGVEYAFTVKGDRGEFTLRSGKVITKHKLERFDPTRVAAVEKKAPAPEPKVPDSKPAAKEAAKIPSPDARPQGDFAKVVSFAAAKAVAAETAAMSPDGRLVATVSSAKPDEASIWDVATKKVAHKLSAGTGLSRIAWSADGKSLATMALGALVGKGVPPRKIVVWDTTTWEQRGSFEDAKVGSSLAISGDGRIVAAAGDPVIDPGYLKAWDVVAKKEILSLPHRVIYVEVVLSDDGRTLCTNAGPTLGDVHLYDLSSGKPRATFKKVSGKLAMSGDASIVASAMYGDGACRVALLDPRSPATPRIIELGKWAPLGVTLIDANRHLVVAGTHDDVHVVRVAAGKVVHTFSASKVRGTNIVKASADSSLLLTYGNDHIARVWSTPFGPKSIAPP